MNRSISLLVLFGMMAMAVAARTFRDTSGEEIEAELVRVQGGQVTIRMGGKEFTLPVSRFSAEDQKFLQEASRPGGAASAPTPGAAPAPEV